MTQESVELTKINVKSLIMKFEKNINTETTNKYTKKDNVNSKIKEIREKFQCMSQKKEFNKGEIIKTNFRQNFSKIKEMFERPAVNSKEMPLKKEQNILKTKPEIKNESRRERILRQRRETNRNRTLVSGHLNYILKNKETSNVVKVSDLKDKVLPSEEVENECSKLKYVNYDE